MAKKNKDNVQFRGQGVDGFGNQVIDPTKNVETRISTERSRADDLRKADEKLRDYQMSTVKEFVDLKASHLKEIQDLHQNYNDKLETKESERLDAKALAVEVQLTIQRERDAAQAMLLAKTVEQNADKIKTDLESSKKENNERFLRVENTLAETKGKSGVTDPLLASYMSDIKDLLLKGASHTGEGTGMKNLWGLIISGIGLLVTLITLITILSKLTNLVEIIKP